MRATLMYAAGDVRVEDVPDPCIVEPTDAIIRVTSACVCGSDLWPYADWSRPRPAEPMGHEAIGLVEDVGADVRTIKRGDLVVMPFAFSDGTCAFCHEGLHTACVHGGFFDGLAPAQRRPRPLRVPLADGTLYRAAGRRGRRADAVAADALRRAGTGHHAAVVAGRQGRASRGGRRRRRGRAVRRDRRQAPRRRADHHHGPPRGPHRAGARVRRHRRRRRARRRGRAARSWSSPAASACTRVLECVGTDQAMETVDARSRVPAAASGASASRTTRRSRWRSRCSSRTSQSAAAPRRCARYIDELLPDILDGTIEPGKVFDRTVDLDGVPDGYRAMADRESIKVLVRP